MYKGKTIQGIILARMGSERLKNKMLLQFGGTTVVEHVIERVKHSKYIDSFVLATTTNPQDIVFKPIARSHGIAFFAGSNSDVVKRMTDTAHSSHCHDILVRICSDNPLLMPSVMDDAIEQLIQTRSDIISPFEFNTLPFGYSAVAMTRHCLKKIDSQAKLKTYREHVENYCFEHPDDFKIRYQKAPDNLYGREINLTIDDDDDYLRLKTCLGYIKNTTIERQPETLIRHVKRMHRQSGTPQDILPGWFPPKAKRGDGERKGFLSIESSSFPRILTVEMTSANKGLSTEGNQYLHPRLLKKLLDEIAVVKFPPESLVAGVRQNPRVHPGFERFMAGLDAMARKPNVMIRPRGEEYVDDLSLQSLFSQIHLEADGNLSVRHSCSSEPYNLGNYEDINIEEVWQSKHLNRHRVDCLNSWFS